MRMVKLALVLCVLAAASGCVKESSDGAEKRFTYESWVPLSIILGGIAVAPVGWLMHRASKKYAWALLIGGPLVAVVFGPGFLSSHVTFNDDRLTCRLSLFTFFGSTETVNFSEVTRVRLTSEETRGRRGRKTTSYYLNFDRTNGEPIKLSADGNLMEAAAKELALRLAKRNIVVIDQAV